VHAADTLELHIAKGELAQLLGVAPSTVSGWIRAGMPTEGTDPRAKVHVRSALEWIVGHLDPFSQAVDRTPGYSRAEQLLQQARDARPELPPGWEVLAGISDPFQRGFTAAALETGYELQRLVAVAAVNEGVPIDAATRLANLVFLVMEVTLGEAAARWGIGGWDPFEAGKALPRDDRAFVHVNWPWLAHQSGQPDWTPPYRGTTWLKLSAEEHAAAVRKGQAEDAARTAGDVEVSTATKPLKRR
jgi:hypothetical protein